MKPIQFCWLYWLGLMFVFNTSLVQAHICQQFLKTHDTTTMALEDELFVPWDQLIPGQSHYGKYIVDHIYVKKNLKIVETKTSKFLYKKIPVIEVNTPDKRYYIMVDNHHTLASFVKENKSDKELLVSVNVIKTIEIDKFDYKTMQGFVDEGFIWSSYAITPKWSLEKNWPKTILQLKDLPLRSMVQLLFLELDLSGKSFNPFIQFYLAELFIKNGYEFSSKSFKSSKKITKAKASLLKFALENPIILETLKNSIVPNDSKNALEKLTAFEASNKAN